MAATGGERTLAALLSLKISMPTRNEVSDEHVRVDHKQSSVIAAWRRVVPNVWTQREGEFG